MYLLFYILKSGENILLLLSISRYINLDSTDEEVFRHFHKHICLLEMTERSVASGKLIFIPTEMVRLELLVKSH